MAPDNRKKYVIVIALALAVIIITGGVWYLTKPKGSGIATNEKETKDKIQDQDQQKEENNKQPDQKVIEKQPDDITSTQKNGEQVDNTDISKNNFSEDSTEPVVSEPLNRKQIEEKITEALKEDTLTPSTTAKEILEPEIENESRLASTRDRQFDFFTLTKPAELDSELDFYSTFMDSDLYKSWSVQYINAIREQEEEIKVVLDSGRTYTATPKGGLPLYLQFIGNAFNHKFGKIYGETIFTFTVAEDGSLENINIVTSPYKQNPDEIIEVLKKGPKWFPTYNGNVPVTEPVRIIIE